jgi:hypothetical protein
LVIAIRLGTSLLQVILVEIEASHVLEVGGVWGEVSVEQFVHQLDK